MSISNYLDKYGPGFQSMTEVQPRVSSSGSAGARSYIQKYGPGFQDMTGTGGGAPPRGTQVGSYQFNQPASQQANPYNMAMDAFSQFQQKNSTDRRRAQLQAQNMQQQAFDLNKKMGAKVDTAINQSHQQNVEAREYLQRMMEDPAMQKVFDMSMDWAENPGLSEQARASMKGLSLQRNAATAASAQRNAMRGAASSGMRGPARAYMQSMLRNQSAMGADNQQRQIDLDVEMSRLQDRGPSMNMAMNALRQRQGIGSQLAALTAGYDPVGLLQRGQSIMQPMQQVGLGIGQNMF